MTESKREPPVLSVVIPAYNEEKRLPRTLTETLAYLNAQPYTAEVLVVDDGSRDGTVALVERFERESSLVRLVRNPTNRGKGYSVRKGVLHSRGDYVLFYDADLATSLDAINPLLDELTHGRADIVIGSRKLESSDVTGSMSRRILSRGFSWSTRFLTSLEIEDTQCGFKGFRGPAARAIFSEQQLDGWSFDCETLMIAERQGWRVKQIPVAWQDVDGSKVTWYAPLKMLLDLIKLRSDFRRRKHERLPTTLAVTVQLSTGAAELRFARNLSSGGMYVVIEPPPPPAGSAVTVSIARPSGEALTLDARVAHAMHPNGVGLEFVQLDWQKREAIGELLQRLRNS